MARFIIAVLATAMIRHAGAQTPALTPDAPVTSAQVSELPRSSQIPVFHRDERDRPPPTTDKSYESDNDPGRDTLRRAALLAAYDLADDLCSKEARRRYIEAASKYVRARFNAAPCVVTRTCSNSDMASIEKAAKDFGTELDHRLREQMEYVHSRGGVKASDFPSDLVSEVRGIVRVSADQDDDTARQEWCAKNADN